ncbi:MAG: hypothetical protein AB2708_05650 [Candidatus Thiodiazotropha taylori]
MTFLKINKPIPTTMFIKGNLIKLRHNGQDRTPFCTSCKTKGHYRLECPNLNGPRWEEPIMDWAQEVESSELTQPRGGEQLPVETESPTQSEKNNEGTITSPGGKQQQAAKAAEPKQNSNTIQESNPRGGRQQTSSEKSENSNPDQEWQEIRHKNKTVKRTASNSGGLTQIMGQIFTQEPKSASKRKSKTKTKSGKKNAKN